VSAAGDGPSGPLRGGHRAILARPSGLTHRPRGPARPCPSAAPNQVLRSSAAGCQCAPHSDTPLDDTWKPWRRFAPLRHQLAREGGTSGVADAGVRHPGSTWRNVGVERPASPFAWSQHSGASESWGDDASPIAPLACRAGARTAPDLGARAALNRRSVGGGTSQRPGTATPSWAIRAGAVLEFRTSFGTSRDVVARSR
jgi:hypothetical protein